jgi:hypothetical protein
LKEKKLEPHFYYTDGKQSERTTTFVSELQYNRSVDDFVVVDSAACKNDMISPKNIHLNILST